MDNDLVRLRVQQGGPYSQGITYRNYEFIGYPEGRGAYEIGDTSVKIDSTPSLVIAEGQYKHAPTELYVNVYTDNMDALRYVTRNHNKYARVQVWLGPVDDIRTAEALEHAAARIRANAGERVSA